MRKPVHAICEQHPRSLISACVVRCLDSIILLVSISKFSSLYLVPVAAQTGLSLTWSETHKTGLPMTWLIFKICTNQIDELPLRTTVRLRLSHYHLVVFHRNAFIR